MKTQRDSTAHTILLPPKHERLLQNAMRDAGLDNVSEFFRRILDEREHEKNIEAHLAKSLRIAARKGAVSEQQIRAIASLLK